MSVYKKLDPETKVKWLAALRSGEFSQRTGFLKAKNKETGEFGYCCLGVLSEISGDMEEKSLKSGVCVSKQNGSYNMVAEGYKGLERSAINALWTMNDYDRRSFEYIANWIEENL